MYRGDGVSGKEGAKVMVCRFGRQLSVVELRTRSWILILLRVRKISSDSYGSLLTPNFSMAMESSENSGDVNVLDSLKGI
jgi:hypothetical protein